MSRRLRFAPSPTGSLHVGNARTALINWLTARRAGGALVLRIEDTDVERSDEASETSILDDLRWMGLDWDEGPDIGGPYGPYRQSERRQRYDEVTRALLDGGHAYPSFETAEQVAELRADAQARDQPFRFRGEHREATPQQAAELLLRGGAALRFKVPDADVRFVDGLRGETGLAAAEISDFVVARADGTPTYNLAVVVDDHDMHIDSVVRGEDHLPNTPRQVLLYRALGWEPPAFFHLPLVLGPDRSRLSKRHGATSVAEMRSGGILPEALCNFLALLGWSPPDEQEVLGMEELRLAYDVRDIAAANSVFDETKLEWLNGQHMAALSPDELLARALPYLGGRGMPVPREPAQRDWLARTVALVGIGKRRLNELRTPLRELLYPSADELFAAAAEIRDDRQARAVLEAFATASREGKLRSPDGYLDTVDAVKETTGAKGRGLFHPLRLAISARETGPGLEQLVPLLDIGAALSLQPPIDSVAQRIEHALGSG